MARPRSDSPRLGSGVLIPLDPTARIRPRAVEDEDIDLPERFASRGEQPLVVAGFGQVDLDAPPLADGHGDRVTEHV